MLIRELITISILKIRGAKIGKGVRVYGKIFVTNPKNLIIGESTTSNHGVYINTQERVTIKNNCRISAGVKIITTALNPHNLNEKHISSPITIEENVWIASGSIISLGVKIEKNSVVGAMSFVNSNVGEKELFAGVPAKKIRMLK